MMFIVSVGLNSGLKREIFLSPRIVTSGSRRDLVSASLKKMFTFTRTWSVPRGLEFRGGGGAGL
jgi:hypothetical protein